ncbi:MAG: anion permease [Oscillospiraceae bacterium]|nr:anion permease [Oscillospiraceae bacterium]
MKKVLAWCKKEMVLTIAMVLAVISAFFVPPDKSYLSYIDFRTLAILFCLMAVMAGLQKSGVFRFVAEKLLQKVKHIRLTAFILVMLCFFSSMLITNDVALITFVPFTFIVLQMIGAQKLAVPVVVMQTIAANLGSMLTPIGNPQNLYLYGKAQMGLGDFVLLMLPYTLVAFLLLGIWCLTFSYSGETRVSFVPQQTVSLSVQKKSIVIYSILFVVSLLTVAHVIAYPVALAVTLVAVLLLDRSVLKDVDYSLLLTFVGFFIFIGNMGRVPSFKELLSQVVSGNEVITSVICSQFMSNVPAALLLSGFTARYDLLIIGTNLGGLGTIIASMASLISFKYIGRDYKTQRGKYLLQFTLLNLLFLAVLLGAWLLLA